MPGPNAPYTKLDSSQVIQQVFDESTDRLRVDATVTASIGDVKITDGTNDATITQVGPKYGLDVNVLNDIFVDISHTDDSIRLGDGVNLITSTTIGPKQGLDVNVANITVDSEGSVQTKGIQIFTKPFDAITATFPSATQEVYASRIGGIAGTIQQTATINYTDATKNDLLNVAVV
jgi:hypothetical protein